MQRTSCAGSGIVLLYGVSVGVRFAHERKAETGLLVSLGKL